MHRFWGLVLGTAAGLTVLPALGEQRVPTPGSDVTFPVEMQFTVDGKSSRYVLTGTALREKFFINVYAVGSYISPEAKIRSADELAAADVPKILLLVFERDVGGGEMVDGLTTGVGFNYDVSIFAKELRSLGAYMRAKPVKKGEKVWIVHEPGRGLRARISGRKDDVVIPNVKFARAVWDVYLGPRNWGEHIKSGLSSRL